MTYYRQFHDILDLCRVVCEYTADLRTLIYFFGRQSSLKQIQISSTPDVRAYFPSGPIYAIMQKRLQKCFAERPFLIRVLSILDTFQLQYEIAGSWVLHCLENPLTWEPSDIDVFIHTPCSAADFNMLRRVFVYNHNIREPRRAMYADYHVSNVFVMYLECGDTLLNIIHVRNQTCRTSAAASFDLQICQTTIRRAPSTTGFTFSLHSPNAYLEKCICLEDPCDYSFLHVERNIHAEAKRILCRIEKYWKRGYTETPVLFAFRSHLIDLTL